MSARLLVSAEVDDAARSAARTVASSASIIARNMTAGSVDEATLPSRTDSPARTEAGVISATAVSEEDDDVRIRLDARSEDFCAAEWAASAAEEMASIIEV